MGGGSNTGGGAAELVDVVGEGGNTGGGSAEVIGVVDVLGVVVVVLGVGEELIVVAAVRMVDVFLAVTAFAAGAVVVVGGADMVVVVTGGGSWTGTCCSVVVVPPATTREVGKVVRALAADCVVLIFGCSSR